MKYRRILQAFAQTPLALMPEKAEEIMAFLELKSTGVTFAPEEIARRIGREPGAAVKAPDLVLVDIGTGLETHYQNGLAIGGTVRADKKDGGIVIDLDAAKPDRATAKASGLVAVVPVFGVISQRVSAMADISGGGGASTERIAQAVRSAAADPQVKAIVLNLDSPGGGVYGVAECADAIFKARGEKPIVAQANSLAASAAYWIASACDEIVVTPSGEVGSIGVYGVHQDWTKAYDDLGVKFTLIKAGKYKAEGVDFAPLGDEAAKAMQSRVDDYYGMFTRAVARGRGVPLAEVVNGFGEGRVVGAQEAVKLRMADRVGTLQDTLSRLGVKSAPTSSSAAAEPASAPVAAEPATPPAADEPAPAPIAVDPDHQRRAHRNKLRQLGAAV